MSVDLSTSQKPIIAFIGAGNMAEAVIGGLYASGHPASHLRYSEPLEARRQYMATKYPAVLGGTDNNLIVQGADVVILAVKPQVMRQVVTELVLTNPNVLIISIAAGIKTEDILRWLNTEEPLSLVRCMPNTPALIGEGAVGLFATDRVSAAQRETTEEIMRAICKQISWVERESQIDAITAISGSGPAYYFLVMEAMQNAGVAAGLSPEVAKALTVQTCLGAGRMALESEDDLATLRLKVTSPNGTTEAAIKSFEAAHIRDIVRNAVFAANERSFHLAEELGKDQ